VALVALSATWRQGFLHYRYLTRIDGAVSALSNLTESPRPLRWVGAGPALAGGAFALATSVSPATGAADFALSVLENLRELARGKRAGPYLLEEQRIEFQ
jgi:hypothetical protein